MFESRTIENDMDWLRQVSEEVDFKKDNLDEMISVLDSYCLTHGVFAMAAVQLGFNKRVIYLKNTDLSKVEDDIWNEKTIIINPVVKLREGLTTYWEACASCLDNTGLVLRPYKLKIEYYDLDGKKHQKTFTGFPATVFSHEFDHLNGVLHMDKALELKVMNKDERREFRKTHDYEIISKTGNFEELEKEYAKNYKN
ncbi:MAG: peptide deformylase [Bacilli bacterium]|nr:peptide deformylase [Bacilli bacterium]